MKPTQLSLAVAVGLACAIAATPAQAQQAGTGSSAQGQSLHGPTMPEVGTHSNGSAGVDSLSSRITAALRAPRGRAHTGSPTMRMHAVV